jgi:hypothetical protein
MRSQPVHQFHLRVIFDRLEELIAVDENLMINT